MNTAWLGGSKQRRLLPNSLSKVARVAFPFLLFILAFIPRAIHPVTTYDLWHSRGIRFIEALLSQDFDATLQAPHPGVITMWLSGITQWLGSSIISNFSDYSVDQQMAAELIPMALVVSLTIVLAYFLMATIFDRQVAVVAALLLALDPYHISLSKAIHVDALVSVFVMISTLFLWAFIKDQRWSYVILSAVFAALGLLSKSPAVFMLPYLFLTLAVWQASKRLFVNRKFSWPDRRNVIDGAKEIGLAIGIWIIPFALVYFLLWPSMWSQPGKTIDVVFGGASHHFETPHPRPLYFLGQSTNEDPGPLFYPITMTIKTTSVVLVGFLLSITLIFNRNLERNKRLALILGVAFIFFFTLMLTFGDKKFVRYALPALQFITLLAGVGYVYFFRWLTKGRTLWLILSLTLVVIIQAAVSLPRHPYYGTHYNYLAGGPRNVLNSGIVDGQEKAEGLEIAGDYLNSLPLSPLLTVGAQKSDSFYRYFDGKVVALTDEEVDYILLARSTLLRRMDVDQWLDTWEAYQNREPKFVVEFDGIPYVWIYKTGPVITDEDFAYQTDAILGENIRLLGYDFEPRTAHPGDTVRLTLYWHTVNETDADYTVFTHLLDGDGQLRAQKDNQPQQGMYPTYLWDSGERIMDVYELTIDSKAPPGDYDFAIGMYELLTNERLPITIESGEPNPDNRLLLPGPMILTPES